MEKSDTRGDTESAVNKVNEVIDKGKVVAIKTKSNKRKNKQYEMTKINK